MTFHPDKCSVLTITNKKNPVKHNYLLHNHTLESVSSAKYLGIILQSDLKWTQHTNNIVANANKKSSHLAAASMSSWRLSQSFWDLIVL
jgi:myo-inositol-hexaphosphate 3-phosphohydrolase